MLLKTPSKPSVWMRLASVFFWIAFSLLAACSHVVSSSRDSGSAGPVKLGKPEQVLQGRASWYGHPFHGRKTANGETYDMYSMTAAHKSLPFGSLLKVTNLDNQRELIVRVNDRGPYIAGRIVDLSFAAAKELGMIHRGVSPVRVEVFSPKSLSINLVAVELSSSKSSRVIN